MLLLCNVLRRWRLLCLFLVLFWLLFFFIFLSFLFRFTFITTFRVFWFWVSFFYVFVFSLNFDLPTYLCWSFKNRTVMWLTSRYLWDCTDINNSSVIRNSSDAILSPTCSVSSSIDAILNFLPLLHLLCNLIHYLSWVFHLFSHMCTCFIYCFFNSFFTIFEIRIMLGIFFTLVPTHFRFVFCRHLTNLWVLALVIPTKSLINLVNLFYFRSFILKIIWRSFVSIFLFVIWTVSIISVWEESIDVDNVFKETPFVLDVCF